jgi:hypothetical protein
LLKDVQVLADSINAATGDRATTMLLTRFPYALLQEPATHRLLRQDAPPESMEIEDQVIGNINPFTRHVSRSSASTRAIPVEKVIERIKADPFIPTFTKHRKGMQGIEDDDPEFQARCEAEWLDQMESACIGAGWLWDLGAHKQDINHLLKPFMRIPILVTATEWCNFFKLRTERPCHPGFRAVALEMEQALAASTPKILEAGQWHVPFGDRMHDGLSQEEQLRVSAARAARLSYASHDGVINPERDLALAEQLIEEGHMGPFEHSLRAMTIPETEMIDSANFRGWLSQRSHIQGMLPLNPLT